MLHWRGSRMSRMIQIGWIESNWYLSIRHLCPACILFNIINSILSTVRFLYILSPFPFFLFLSYVILSPSLSLEALMRPLPHGLLLVSTWTLTGYHMVGLMAAMQCIVYKKALSHMYCSFVLCTRTTILILQNPDLAT